MSIFVTDRPPQIDVPTNLVDRAVQGEEDGLVLVRRRVLVAPEERPLLTWSQATSVWGSTTALAAIEKAAIAKPFHTRPPAKKSSLADYLDWNREFIEFALQNGLGDPIAAEHKIFSATPLFTLKVYANCYATEDRYGGLDPNDVNDPDAVTAAIERAQMPKHRLELVLGCSLKPCELPKYMIGALAREADTTDLLQVLSQFVRMVSEGES